MKGKPWFLELFQMRVRVSSLARNRIDELATRHGLSRGKVVDCLVRAVEPNDLDVAIVKVQEADKALLASWQESGNCIQS